MKHNTILLTILLALQAICLPIHGQTRGIGAVTHCTTAVDSIMLRRQNDLYTGRRGTLYNDWTNNPFKFYPMMNEAWLYCVNTCPEQYNLYLDGCDIARYMVQQSKNQADSALYFQKLMDVYDMRISNLDSINAHVRKVALKSSEGAVRMRQVNEWDNLYGKNFSASDAQYAEKLYNRYLPVIQSLADSMGGDNDFGGDLKPSDLKRFFWTSTNHYIRTYNLTVDDTARKEAKDAAKKQYDEDRAANTAWYNAYRDSLKIPNAKTLKRTDVAAVTEYNEKMAKIGVVRDSIMKENTLLRQRYDSIVASINESGDKQIREARGVITNHYNFIKDIVDVQKSSLGKDFVGSANLSDAELQLQIDSAIAIVGAPYDELIAYCQQNMEAAGINLEENTMDDLYNKYNMELSSHADSLQWLYRIKLTCEATIDFAPDHYFYQQVDKLFTAAYDKAMASQAGSGMAQVKVQQENKNYTLARRTWLEANKTKDGTQRCKLILLAAYYFDLSAAEDPGHASTYRKFRKQLTSTNDFETNVFFSGIKSGQSITVNGVTFNARF